MSTQWYYTENGQQQGPVSAQELRAYADSGRLRPTDLVWREGMANWVEAQKVKGLLPAAPTLSLQPETPPPSAPSASSYIQAAASPYEAPAMETQTYGQRQDGYNFSRWPVKPANFWLYLGLFLAGLLLMVAWGVSLEDPEQISTGNFALMGLGLVLLIAAGVLGFIYLYRAWYMIQDGHNTRTTPGKAVGFLFIPLFNLYWMFIAYWGWSKDYHDFIDEHSLHDAPRVNENLFLAAAILNIVGGLITILAIASLIVWFIIIYQMCTAINYFAKQSQN